MIRSQLGLVMLAGAALVLLAGLLMLNRQLKSATLASSLHPSIESGRESADAALGIDARATADRVLEALQARDGSALATLVHPTGVRFSPSAYVDVAADQVLRPAEAVTLWSENDTRI